MISMSNSGLQPVSPLHSMHGGRHRAHPPRLQHSPSLPNLWLPPHDGPIPPHLSHSARDSLHRPSTPPSLSSLEPTSAAAMSINPPSTEQKKSHHEKLKSNSQSKAHLLLTPPLTPSSSLRSDSSRGGAADESSIATLEQGEFASPPSAPVRRLPTADGITEDEIPPSRFVLVRNVPKDVPTDSLRCQFFQFFDWLNPSGSSGPSRVETTDNSPIKGIYVSFQRQQGIVILAFWDLVVAGKAKRAIELGSASEAREGENGSVSMGQDRREGTVGFVCEFILPEQLSKMIGKSTFVTETDGRFFVSAGPVANDDSETGGDTVVNRGTNRRRFLAPESLRDILSQFGKLCVFGDSVATQGVDGSVEGDENGQIFRVEYSDVRDADAAYSTLNGRVLYGLKLRLFGREEKRDVEGVQKGRSEPQSFRKVQDSNDDAQESGSPLTPSTPTSNYHTGSISFPKGYTNDEQSTRSQNEVPEHYSHVEELSSTRRVRPRSVSAGNSAGQDFPTIAHRPSSPIATPYLYSSQSSHPADEVTPPTADQHSRSGSNHLFFDAIGRPHQQFQTRNKMRVQEPPSSSNTGSEAGPADVSAPPPTIYSQQQHAGYYSFPPHPMGSYYEYPPGGSSPRYGLTPSPVAISPLSFPFPPVPSVGAPGYTYEPESQQPWAMENPIIMGAASPPAPEYYYSGGVYYHPQQDQYHSSGMALPNASIPHDPHYLQPHYHQYHNYPPASFIHPPSPSAPPHLSNTPPSPPYEPTVSRDAVSSERNQLNLGKIEDGQDTRTTVMIKNIPNKMSDKDLITYIGRVCPRKIDFLYLRMDFQNGCNVGYAFVNFIQVEDLLHFARAKLGVKWNMFSSEKVLQMSYANYQGKEALVEKFKNSCIMDEREAWRPKIFYSDPGPNQGLPEPFPSPTHLKRKERSSNNRGALFTPGVGGGGGQSPQHHRRP